MNRIYSLAFACVSYAVVLGLLAVPGFSQTSANTCQHKTISVSVIDRAWAPARDLKSEDFRAEYKNQPVKILSVQPDERPHNIVILVDASGSMARSEKSEGAWPFTLALASDLARIRLKNTHYALLIFNEAIVDRVDFSDDDNAVLRKLQEISADAGFEKANVREGTSLWDAAATAARLFQNSDSANLIYAITDGGDNRSSLKVDDLKRRLSAAGVRFYCALVDPVSTAIRRAPEVENTATNLYDVSWATGGITLGPVENTNHRFSLPGAAALKISEDQLLGNFYRSMLTGYRIELEFPDNIAKRGQLKLELTKERQAELKRSQVSYSREVEPCTQSGTN